MPFETLTKSKEISLNLAQKRLLNFFLFEKNVCLISLERNKVDAKTCRHEKNNGGRCFLTWTRDSRAKQINTQKTCMHRQWMREGNKSCMMSHATCPLVIDNKNCMPTNEDVDESMRVDSVGNIFYLDP